MDAAVTAKSRAFELLLLDCFALDDDGRRPTARARLEASLGGELTRRLMLMLCAP